MEPGCAFTLMDRAIDRSEVSSTSIRFAVKLAMYRTPRRSSSAISAALPPIGTTRPKTPAQPVVDITRARMPPLSARNPKRLVIRYAPATLLSLGRHLNRDRRRHPALPDDQRYGLTAADAVRRLHIDLINPDSSRCQPGEGN